MGQRKRDRTWLLLALLLLLLIPVGIAVRSSPGDGVDPVGSPSAPVVPRPSRERPPIPDTQKSVSVEDDDPVPGGDRDPEESPVPPSRREPADPYELVVEVTRSGGGPEEGSAVYVLTAGEKAGNRGPLGFEFADESGHAVFQLAPGTYDVGVVNWRIMGQALRAGVGVPETKRVGLVLPAEAKIVIRATKELDLSEPVALYLNVHSPRPEDSVLYPGRGQFLSTTQRLSMGPEREMTLTLSAGTVYRLTSPGIEANPVSFTAPITVTLRPAALVYRIRARLFFPEGVTGGDDTRISFTTDGHPPVMVGEFDERLPGEKPLDGISGVTMLLKVGKSAGRIAASGLVGGSAVFAQVKFKNLSPDAENEIAFHFTRP